MPAPTSEPNPIAAAASSEHRWHARDARAGDRPKLIEVFNAAFHRGDDAKLLEWRYDRSPHGKAWTVVAADDAADEVVGAYSYAPRFFRIEGARSTVMQASDAMVFPEWQRKGIFRRLDDVVAERAAAEKIPFGFAFCGRRSQKGFLANGWKAIAPYRTWTRVLRASSGAFEARRSDGRLRRALVPLEARRARKADPAIRAALEGHEDQPVEHFPREIEKLPDPPWRIVGERDPGWLSWRYLFTPRRTHAPFLVRRAGKLVGYYDVEANSRGRGYLLDVRGVDAEAERAALAFAVERLRSVGSAAIQTTVLEGSFLDQHVRWLGFEPPRDPAPLPFIVRVFTPGPAAEAALDPRSWYVLDGDRDAEGMT